MTKALKRTTFLLWMVALCVGSFKVFLISNTESGIRIDDLFIGLAVCSVFLSGRWKEVRLSRAVKAYCIFLAVGVLSSLWNGLSGRVPTAYSFLFVARQAQYMAFFWFGYLLYSRRKAVSKILLVYAAVLVVVVPCQMLGLVPVPGDFGTARASGNTNGPYELAAVASFLICYFGYEYRRWWPSTAGVFLVILSASRITSCGLLLSVLRVGIKKTSRAKLAVTAVVIVTLLPVAVAAVTLGGLEFLPFDNSQLVLLSRFAGSSVPVEELGSIYDLAPTYRSSEAYVSEMYSEASDLARMDLADVSAMIRMYRWTSLVKSTLQSADSVLLGVGPSFGTVAVDGYFVRVFVETGALGLISFVCFLACLSGKQTSMPLREYVFILAATACFIDIFVSYKPMILLWLWHGLTSAAATEDAGASCIPNEG